MANFHTQSLLKTSQVCTNQTGVVCGMFAVHTLFLPRGSYWWNVCFKEVCQRADGESMKWPIDASLEYSPWSARASWNKSEGWNMTFCENKNKTKLHLNQSESEKFCQFKCSEITSSDDSFKFPLCWMQCYYVDTLQTATNCMCMNCTQAHPPCPRV